MATKTSQDIFNLSKSYLRPGTTFEHWKQSAKLPYTDDDYLAEIEQYKDKPWYDQLLNNPWLAGNQSTFSPNLGQSILSLLGDDSSEDKYYAELKSNRSQWLSEFLEKMRQQDYNSPLQQAQREQLAGINSDLSGNIDAGSAAENDQPILGHPSFGDDGSLSAIGTFFMNIYSLASGFAKDAMSMQSMMNQLTSEDLDINKRIVSSTNEFIKGHTALGQVQMEDGSYQYQVIPPSDDDIKEYAVKNFRSRSARKKFIHEVKTSYPSGRGREASFSSLASGQKAKSDLAVAVGRNEAFGNNELDPMIIVEKNLSKMSRDIVEAQNKYTSDYFHSADGKQAADASNATNKGIVDDQEVRSYQRSIDKVINRTMESIIKELEQASKIGGWKSFVAKGMLGFISAYRLQMLPQLPSISLRGMIDNKNFNTTNNTYE